jgi:hypothetical protein
MQGHISSSDNEIKMKAVYDNKLLPDYDGDFFQHKL